jgi:hypothetical protein
VADIREQAGYDAATTTAASDVHGLRDIALGRSGESNGDGIGAGRLKVWSWWERDPITLAELAFIMATSRKAQVRQKRDQFGLPGEAFIGALRATQPGYALAVRRPFRLLWMTLDNYAARSHQWLEEEQLRALRESAAPSERQKGASPRRA